MKISRTLPRKPGPATPRDPRNTALYLVRYVDVKGQTASQVFWQATAAWAMQDWVRRAGGHANVYRTDVEWRLLG